MLSTKLCYRSFVNLCCCNENLFFCSEKCIGNIKTDGNFSAIVGQIKVKTHGLIVSLNKSTDKVHYFVKILKELLKTVILLRRFTKTSLNDMGKRNHKNDILVNFLTCKRTASARRVTRIVETILCCLDLEQISAYKSILKRKTYLRISLVEILYLRGEPDINFCYHWVIMTLRTWSTASCYLRHFQIFDKIDNFPKKFWMLWGWKKENFVFEELSNLYLIVLLNSFFSLHLWITAENKTKLKKLFIWTIKSDGTQHQQYTTAPDYSSATAKS